jgi:hypothetical protein
MDRMTTRAIGVKKTEVRQPALEGMPIGMLRTSLHGAGGNTPSPETAVRSEPRQLLPAVTHLASMLLGDKFISIKLVDNHE